MPSARRGRGRRGALRRRAVTARRRPFHDQLSPAFPWSGHLRGKRAHSVCPFSVTGGDQRVPCTARRHRRPRCRRRTAWRSPRATSSPNRREPAVPERVPHRRDSARRRRSHPRTRSAFTRNGNVRSSTFDRRIERVGHVRWIASTPSASGRAPIAAPVRFVKRHGRPDSSVPPIITLLSSRHYAPERVRAQARRAPRAPDPRCASTFRRSRRRPPPAGAGLSSVPSGTNTSTGRKTPVVHRDIRRQQRANRVVDARKRDAVHGVERQRQLR